LHYGPGGEGSTSLPPMAELDPKKFFVPGGAV
jgi:hypothetical protein